MHFEHKIYRCEWLIVIQEVDQYGNNMNEKTILNAFPRYYMAFEKMPEYGYEHEFVKGRWIPLNASHGYEELQIQYREQLVPYISPP